MYSFQRGLVHWPDLQSVRNLPGTGFPFLPNQPRPLLQLLNIFRQDIQSRAAIPKLPLRPDFDQTGISQLLEMVGNGGLRNRKPRDDSPTGEFVGRCCHFLKNLKPPGIRKGLGDTLEPVCIHDVI